MSVDFTWSVITFVLPYYSYTGVTVYFDSLTYGVKEGNSAVVALATDGELAVPFNITVHLRDGSATGKCLNS